jgi:hypothetical protein
MDNSEIKELNISVAPLTSPEVEYFEEVTIPISITNNSRRAVLIESVTVRFQTDSNNPPVYIEKNLGTSIEVNSLVDLPITLSPTPEFRANTNVFDIAVTYKQIENQILGPQKSEKLQGAYLIINPSHQKLGKLFISLKQPEDLKLGNLLAQFAERAGFTVYMAVNDPQPGVSLWEKIEPELRSSEAVLVLWTKHTQWGGGVQHEVELCRNFGISDILLIQQGLELPEAYAGTEKEYIRFDLDEPQEDFARVISAQRKIILSKYEATFLSISY